MKEFFQSLYYQVVNFIQGIPNLWFGIICLLLFAGSLVSLMRFYKIYNGTQKSFEKVSLLIISLVLFAVLIILAYLRK